MQAISRHQYVGHGARKKFFQDFSANIHFSNEGNTMISSGQDLQELPDNQQHRQPTITRSDHAKSLHAPFGVDRFRVWWQRSEEFIIEEVQRTVSSTACKKIQPRRYTHFFQGDEKMKKKNFSTGLLILLAILLGASRLVADIMPGGEEEYFYSTYTSFFPLAVGVSYSGEGFSYFSIKSFVFLTAIRVGDRTLSGARFWLLAAANTPIGNYNGKFTIVFKSGAQSDTLTRNVVVTVPPPTTVEENDRSMLPARYTLHQNFPNPFNPETTIAFDLPTAQQVVIRLYDLHGRAITTLVNNNFPAGRHRVSWNGRDGAGRNLPSGVYLYRISAGQFTQTRKMSLLR